MSPVEMFALYGTPVLVALLLTGIAYLSKNSWLKRGYDRRPVKWGALITASALVAVALGEIVSVISHSGSIGGSVAAMGFLLVFSSVTDLMLLKIPSEPTMLAQAIGAALFVINANRITTEGFITVGFFAVILLILWVTSFMRLLGGGDYRILTAIFLLFAWWMPPTLMAVALLGMAALGLVTSLMAHLFGFGVKKTTGESTRWNPETGKNEAVASNEKDQKGKKRTFFPFGPSILVAFTVVAMVAAFTSELPVTHF